MQFLHVCALLHEGNDLHLKNLKNLHEQHPDLIPETYLSASRHIRRLLVSNSVTVASRWEKSITSCITHTSWDAGEDLWVSHNWDAPGGAAAGVVLHHCMAVKKGRADEQQVCQFPIIKSDWTHPQSKHKCHSAACSHAQLVTYRRFVAALCVTSRRARV